jgi:hypothetical protein
MFKKNHLLSLVCLCLSSVLPAQVVLFSENFDSCSLPAGWEVKTIGNPNPVWYVGDAVLNDDNNGQSMNGSCFLFIDDDATGDQTPAYQIDFLSPPFNASQYPTVELSVDVHYRDWGEAEEFFEVLVDDGNRTHLLRRYDKFRKTGNNVYEYETLVFDLALVTNSPNARLIFRYNDAGGYAWWAGFDNISVVGKGWGQNIIAEAFNECQKPSGWETEAVTGIDDWQFGYITEGAALWAGNSMDGTCFVFFDDDFLGADRPFSNIRLKSPWFDGSQFAYYWTEFDLIMRYYSERIALIVEHENGDEFIVGEAAYDIGGPYFPNYSHIWLDLTPFRAKKMRIVFEYDDGKDWGWWAGIDNVKVTGGGSSNDVCANAQTIYTNQACVAANNTNALLDGPPATCVGKTSGSLWYRWTADFDGMAKISTAATFNDVIEIFAGDCDTPQPLHCNNRDEHGFTGESFYFPATSGQTYLIRVSGLEGSFGKSRGELCIRLEQTSQAPPPPSNDHCADALPLVLGASCETGTNLHAGTSAVLPSYNLLARHDVWYVLQAPPPSPTANELLQVVSNANFSEIITAYTGNCDNLVEVAANHKGGSLEWENNGSGTTYYIQISGSFATVEGALCPQFLLKNNDAPDNNLCAQALPIAIGGACKEGNNVGATFSGITPPCVPTVGGDVWYRFVAPTSGAVRINTGATFPLVLAVWKGACGTLENIYCGKNPLPCDGYVTLGALAVGETYYVQIAAQSGTAGAANGSFCLHLTDGALAPPFKPLVLTVDEKCVGDDITQVKVHVSGGIEPYQWSGTPDGALIDAGQSYLVVVSDAVGCEISVGGQAEECEAVACALSGTLTATSPKCSDSNDGTLTALITGGITPYRHEWSNGLSTATIDGLAAGAYALTATDAVGCEITLRDTLVAPPAITLVPDDIQQPNQGQSNGQISVTAAGGTGDLQYQWQLNGAPFSQEEDLGNAPAGEFRLVVTDANSCSASFDFTLTEIVGTGNVTEAFFTEIFPNPASDRAWLAVAFPQAQSLHLTITDASGRTLHTWTVRSATEQNIPIDLKNLPNGKYQLSVRTEKFVWTEAIIVTKK